MTVQTIPNMEAVIGDYLRAHPYLTIVNARVAGTLPSEAAKQTAPWVKITQLDATDTGGVEHLIDYLLQFDCYAGSLATIDHVGQSEASLLARSVRAALKAAQGTVLAGSVVISSVAFQGMPRLPDPDFEPARERYVLSVAIHAHLA